MSKNAEFMYNAPQFVDLAGFNDSDGADEFFDVETDVVPVSLQCDNKENRQPVGQPSPRVKIEPENRQPVRQKTPRVKIEPEIIPVRQPSPQMKIEPLSPELQSSAAKVSDKSSEKLALKSRKRLTIGRRLSGRFTSQDTETEDLSENLVKLSVKAKKRTHFDGIPLNVTEEKEHAMQTRKDEVSKTPKLELRTRTVNKDQAAMENRKRKSVFGDIQNTIGGSTTKYMAVAEQILHFQKDTPPRFHTSRRRSSGGARSLFKSRQSYNPRKTIARTPKLMTKLRSRPSYMPSHQEKEDRELEEMKKHQVKPLPLNEKVLQPPKPLQKAERAPTVQVPFNITEVFKKPAPVTEVDPFKFTAKPVPTHILEKPVGLGRRSQLPVTVPQSPAITKSYRFQNRTRVVAAANNIGKETSAFLDSQGVPSSKLSKPKKTEPKPFSFEVRDKELMERKESKIKEVFEAERKAREFRATPAPQFKHAAETSRALRHSHLNSSKSSCFSIDEEPRSFKARSPRVLRQPPFQPNLEHSHSQPLDIQLRTERRVQERQEFEVKQMEKEERIAMLKEQLMMEKKRQEEEEIAKLRQEIVHKAQPMPNFKSPRIAPLQLKPLTEPMSPRFSKRTGRSQQK